jgi:hypothetical protein
MDAMRNLTKGESVLRFIIGIVAIVWAFFGSGYSRGFLIVIGLGIILTALYSY